MERHILREGTSSCSISSSWSHGVPTLAPPCNLYSQRGPNASDRLRIPGSTPFFWLDWLSKTDHVVLLSHGLLPVTHLLDRPAPMLSSPCLLITTWQLVKAHRVIMNEAKIHVSSHYITFVLSTSVHRQMPHPNSIVPLFILSRGPPLLSTGDKYSITNVSLYSYMTMQKLYSLD